MAEEADVPPEEAEDVYIIAYTSTPDAVRASAKYFVPPVLGPQNTDIFGGVFMAWVVVGAIAGVASAWMRTMLAVASGLAVAAVTAFGVTALVLRARYHHRQFVTDPRRMGLVVVRLDFYGVTIATDVSSDFLSWFGIRKVEVVGEGVFFRSGPFHGILVPRGGFESDAAFDEFCTQMHRYRDNKREPPHFKPANEPPPDGPALLN